MSKYWCISPKQNAAFVAAMEDVLEVYSLPFDPSRPVVCMDEKPLQLLVDARKRVKKKDGSTAIDNEYVRKDTASIFLFTEPLGGCRHADAEEHRTRIDWANKIKWLVDEAYPEVEVIVLVCDNLNTHNVALLY